MDAVVVLALQQKVSVIDVPGHTAFVVHNLAVGRRSDEAALGLFEICLSANGRVFRCCSCNSTVNFEGILPFGLKCCGSCPFAGPPSPDATTALSTSTENLAFTISNLVARWLD